MNPVGLPANFFERDVLEVAPELLGKNLVRKTLEGKYISGMITEVEAYRGEEDLACHARKGRTPRTEIMYQPGGYLYIYLIYGMYYMLNIVTGPVNHPQAILIRATDNVEGPGRLTRHFAIDKSVNGLYLPKQNDIWITDNPVNPLYKTTPRIGIDYATDEWKYKPWRFVIL